MPSGYTSKLYEGEQSFEDFAWGVARGFGALVELRDTPDATIPDEFAPSSYHLEAIKDARSDLAAAQAWTDSDAAKRELGERHEAEERRDRDIHQRAVLRDRYEAMLERARAFVPPTPGHEEFKRTMIEQLERSIDFDCGSFVMPVPAPCSPAEYRAEAIEQALKDIAYHEREYAKELERARQRTQWVRDLAAALETVATTVAKAD